METWLIPVLVILGLLSVIGLVSVFMAMRGRPMTFAPAGKQAPPRLRPNVITCVILATILSAVFGVMLFIEGRVPNADLRHHPDRAHQRVRRGTARAGRDARERPAAPDRPRRRTPRGAAGPQRPEQRVPRGDRRRARVGP